MRKLINFRISDLGYHKILGKYQALFLTIFLCPEIAVIYFISKVRLQIEAPNFPRLNRKEESLYHVIVSLKSREAEAQLAATSFVHMCIVRKYARAVRKRKP